MDKNEDQPIDVPELPDEDHEPKAPRKLTMSRELRGWIAGLSALAVAFAAVGLPTHESTASVFQARPGEIDTKGELELVQPNCRGIDITMASSLRTNIPSKAAKDACTLAQQPALLLEPSLVTSSQQAARVEYSTEFTVGAVVSIGANALLPAVINEQTITAHMTGSGALADLCASVEVDVAVQASGVPLDANSESIVLFPHYFVAPPLVDTGGSGYLQRSMSIQVTGVGPSAAELGTWPVVECSVEILMSYTNGIMPHVHAIQIPVISYPPADIILKVGNCAGSEGTANCASAVAGLAAGQEVIIAGPWEEIRITPSMLYTWTDGSRVDEDKARIVLSPGGDEAAKEGSGTFQTAASVHAKDTSVRYCAGMEVRDVDQAWDFDGAQRTARDEFCLNILYKKVAPEALRALDCTSGLLTHNSGRLACLTEGIVLSPVIPGNLGTAYVVVDSPQSVQLSQR